MSEEPSLNMIAARLADEIIGKNDKRQLRVTFEFDAKREGTGMWLSAVSLGYVDKKPDPSSPRSG